MRAALKKIALRTLGAAFVSVAFTLSVTLPVAAKPAVAPPKVTTATMVAPKISTLADYRARVQAAVAPLEELAAFCEQLKQSEKPAVWSKKGFDPDVSLQLPKREAAAFGKVRSLLPMKERVEWGGSSIEVDNSWLESALEEYGNSSDNGNRAAALRVVAERLRSLASRLDEPAGEQDKDAERGRLNTILRDPEFNKKAEQGGALRRIIEQFFKWLSDLFPKTGFIRPGASPRSSQLAQIIVIALCAAVLLYVGWHFWRRRARGPRPLKLKREARVVLGERLEADQSAADLLEAAERLAREGNLRGAIRKAYIALLCELGDRGVIRLEQHKTNRDYLQAVRSAAAPSLYTEMMPLTFNFELHWYGSHEASEADWTDFRARCRQALKAI